MADAASGNVARRARCAAPVVTLALTLALALTVPASCIALVDESVDLGATCQFAGRDTTACGQCIARTCQSRVNTCCRSASCSPHLADLDTCGATGRCGALASDDTSSTDAISILVSCVRG